jgi:large subunit ribosomal protein L29
MPSKAAELRELPEDELYARMESAKEELFNLRFQLATGQLDNTGRLKELRHDVARIATVLREREIEEELDAIVATESVGATATAQANDDETHEDGETQ